MRNKISVPFFSKILRFVKKQETGNFLSNFPQIRTLQISIINAVRMTGKISLLSRPRSVYSKPFLNPNHSKITTSCNSGQSHEKRRTSWRAELAGKKDSLNMLHDEHPLAALPSKPFLAPFY